MLLAGSVIGPSALAAVRRLCGAALRDCGSVPLAEQHLGTRLSFAPLSAGESHGCGFFGFGGPRSLAGLEISRSCQINLLIALPWRARLWRFPERPRRRIHPAGA